jgi:hypothetical protein
MQSPLVAHFSAALLPSPGWPPAAWRSVQRCSPQRVEQWASAKRPIWALVAEQEALEWPPVLAPELAVEEKVVPERQRPFLRVVVAEVLMARQVAALNRHRHPKEARKALRPPAVMEVADRLRR